MSEEIQAFLGIDAGGTETKLVACDAYGSLLGSSLGGPANHLSIGLEGTEDSLRRGLQSAGLEHLEFKAAYIGFSGLDIGSTSEKLEKLSRRVLNTETLLINNDCYNALYGAFCGGSGIAAIAGTGSMVLCMDSEGNVKHVGGWGHLLGDWGSAYRISMQGIQESLKCYDGITDTILRERMEEHFGFRSKSDIIRFFYLEDHSKSLVAGFAPSVIQAAEEGDESAQRIVAENAHILAASVISLSQRDGIKERACLIGGLKRSDYFTECFRSELGKSVTIVEPEMIPVYGAVLIAMEAVTSVDAAVLRRLKKLSERGINENRIQ
jgi:N-acetylglucosamine kinase-like BadF-type ATPase